MKVTYLIEPKLKSGLSFIRWLTQINQTVTVESVIIVGT